MKIGRRTPEGIWRVQRQNNKSASTHPSKERRKILSGNRCLQTCYRRSFILETGRKMETHCVSVQDNATSRKELQDLWQGTTCYSGSFNKMETIFAGHYWEIQSLDRPWKSQVFLKTSQVEWTTSKIVSKVTRLQLYTMIYSRKSEY